MPQVKAGKMKALAVSTAERSGLMPDIREKLRSQYMEPIGGSPQQLTQFMNDELRNWTPIIRRSGASVE
jgi:tripartite-type tricarboxylate transporter receptor subunit TctC